MGVEGRAGEREKEVEREGIKRLREKKKKVRSDAVSDGLSLFCIWRTFRLWKSIFLSFYFPFSLPLFPDMKILPHSFSPSLSLASFYLLSSVFPSLSISLFYLLFP